MHACVHAGSTSKMEDVTLKRMTPRHLKQLSWQPRNACMEEKRDEKEGIPKKI